MRDLQLVGVSDAGGHIVVAGDDGQEFRIPVDARLGAVVRSEQARAGQLAVELASQLRPAEIQARIRAGATAEEVASAAGVSLERIRRYEGPVLAEREFVVTAARGIAPRRGHDTPSPAPVLGDLVDERLAVLGAAGPAWDSRRRDDGCWVVSVSYVVGGSPASASWVYDAVRRTVTPEPDGAELLDPAPVSVPDDALAPGRVRRLSSVPPAPEAADPFNLVISPAPLDVRVTDVRVTDVHTTEVIGSNIPAAAHAGPERTAGADDSEVLHAAPEDPPPLPRRAAAGRGRRASVPAWDDIMFGSRKQD